MRETTPSGDTLRALLTEEGPLRVPEALSPLMAASVERAGFRAMYCGGGAIAGLYFGQPDLGLVAPVEFLPFVRAIAESTSLPVIADLDHGAETALGVGRVVRMFEDAGTAGIHLEDTTSNKKVKGLSTIMPLESYRRHVGTAVNATRRGMLVIARTDAWMVDGTVDDVVERGRVAAAEGAELFFAPFTPREHWAEIAAGVPIPVLDINPPDQDSFERLKVVVYTGVLMRRIAELCHEVNTALAEHGSYEITAESRALTSDLLDEAGILARIPGADSLVDGRTEFTPR